ncbi:hypothetical protein F2Q70_00039917 [Brassica cretica]|uniref:Uncharacterized protein n=1 Tax=Brassica cretica TaxID=69181 RepID=A0A8S9K6H4_BRACR|nr:hypothetical protein F2Q70_00039917 [Brassica cretica]
MAMQYISHSNETERRARILRVQQSIELEKSNPPAVLTKISHNLEKEKGHVFGYGVSESASGETRTAAHALTAPAGERIHSSAEVQLSGESISPASAPKRPAVFTIGASGSSQTGSSRGRRNGRNRPPAWRMVGKVGIEEAITRGWSGDTSGVTSSVMDRLSRCRRELSRWKKSSQFNSLTKIQRLQKELEFEIAKVWPSARKMKLKCLIPLLKRTRLGSLKSNSPWISKIQMCGVLQKMVCIRREVATKCCL